MGDWMERLGREAASEGLPALRGQLHKHGHSSAILAGSGPSLSGFNPPPGWEVFTVNHAAYHFPNSNFGCCFERLYSISEQTKVLFVSDRGGCSGGSLLTVPLYKDGLHQRIPRPPWLHEGVRSNNMRSSDYGISTDLGRGIYLGHTSAHAAVQILDFLGVKKIYLIGVDFVNTETTHFFGEVEEKRGKERESWFDSCMDLFENITPRYKEERGIDLINISPISRLREVMPDESSKFHTN